MTYTQEQIDDLHTQIEDLTDRVNDLTDQLADSERTREALAQKLDDAQTALDSIADTARSAASAASR